RVSILISLCDIGSPKLSLISPDVVLKVKAFLILSTVTIEGPPPAPPYVILLPYPPEPLLLPLELLTIDATESSTTPFPGRATPPPAPPGQGILTPRENMPSTCVLPVTVFFETSTPFWTVMSYHDP